MVRNVDPTTGSNLDLSVQDDRVEGSNLGTSRKEIDELLDKMHILKGSPFQAFYFVVSEIIMHRGGGSMKKEMDAFAQHLNQLSKWAKQLNNLKDEFFSANDPNSTNAANFSEDVKSLMNSLLKKWHNNKDAFPMDQKGITHREFDSIVSALERDIKTNPQHFNELFPTLGSSVIDVVKSFEKLGNVLFRYKHSPDDSEDGDPMAPSELWKESKETTEDKDGLITQFMNPDLIQDPINALSSLSSKFMGIGATETSRLKYKQQNYNRLVAFVHDVYNDWQKMKKSAMKHFTER